MTFLNYYVKMILVFIVMNKLNEVQIRISDLYYELRN